MLHKPLRIGGRDMHELTHFLEVHHLRKLKIKNDSPVQLQCIHRLYNYKMHTWSGDHWWSVCRSENSFSRKRLKGSANFLAALWMWWQLSPSMSSKVGQSEWRILVSRPDLLPRMTLHESIMMLTRFCHGMPISMKKSVRDFSKLAAVTFWTSREPRCSTTTFSLSSW